MINVLPPAKRFSSRGAPPEYVDGEFKQENTTWHHNDDGIFNHCVDLTVRNGFRERRIYYYFFVGLFYEPGDETGGLFPTGVGEIKFFRNNSIVGKYQIFYDRNLSENNCNGNRRPADLVTFFNNRGQLPFDVPNVKLLQIYDYIPEYLTYSDQHEIGGQFDETKFRYLWPLRVCGDCDRVTFSVNFLFDCHGFRVYMGVESL
jgi:hypothetical protein